jgi:hypothetical protein
MSLKEPIDTEDVAVVDAEHLRSIRGVKDNSSNDYTNFTVTKEDNEK